MIMMDRQMNVCVISVIRSHSVLFLFKAIITITENNIDLSDFERVIDPLTGREILRMKADVLKAKGLEELENAEFEIIIDAVTGQSIIELLLIS
jgi:predicted small secreted protein